MFVMWLEVVRVSCTSVFCIMSLVSAVWEEEYYPFSSCLCRCLLQFSFKDGCYYTKPLALYANPSCRHVNHEPSYSAVSDAQISLPFLYSSFVKRCWQWLQAKMKNSTFKPSWVSDKIRARKSAENLLKLGCKWEKLMAGMTIVILQRARF